MCLKHNAWSLDSFLMCVFVMVIVPTIYELCGIFTYIEQNILTSSRLRNGPLPFKHSCEYRQTWSLINKGTVLWPYNAVNLSKNLTKVGIVFLCSNSGLYSASVAEVIYQLSYHIVPCSNGTRLYNSYGVPSMQGFNGPHHSRWNTTYGCDFVLVSPW